MNLSVTLIQSNLHWESIPANLAMFDEKISSIKESTDLILLPEMFSTGFTMSAERLAETMDGTTVKWMHEKAKEKNAVICGSFICKDGGKYYNRLVWMRPDGSLEYYDKRHLFGYGDENNHYTRGNGKIIVELKGFKILPLVCYDLRFPVWSRNTNDYDVLIYVSNWPERRIYAWKQLLIARAIENQSYVIGVNRVGDDGNRIYYSGNSSVIDMKGEVLFRKEKEETTFTISLSKENLDTYRKEFRVLADRDEFKLL
jgi:predicted amidohydrolase